VTVNPKKHAKLALRADDQAVVLTNVD